MRPNRQSKQNHLVLHALQKFMILWREKFVFSKQHHNFFPHSKGFILGTDPLLISTDFLKYPFRQLFQTGVKFQL